MLSAFKRRSTLLNEQGEEVTSSNRDRPSSGEKRRPTSFQLCMQLILLCACVVILSFGLAVSAIGLWGHQSQKDYLAITDKDPELTRLPFSMIVTGVFVAILGGTGIIGSIFSRTITGQILLGVFSFVLVLVIVSEVGAGSAAIRLRRNLESKFVNSAKQSQKEYELSETVSDNWDNFQQEHHCCGAEGYVGEDPPYLHVFGNDSVPTSCCINIEPSEKCEEYANNATRYKDYIYQNGCPSAVVDALIEKVTVIAIIAIVIGSTQLLAVLLAVVVAYMSSKLDLDKGNYSYNKLRQQEDAAVNQSEEQPMESSPTHQQLEKSDT